MADNIVQYIINISAKDAKKALDDLAKESKKASEEVDKLGDESKETADDLDKFSKETKKSSRNSKNLGRELEVLKRSFKGVGTAVGVAVGAVAGMTATAIGFTKVAFDLSRSVVDNVNALNDLSAQSGLSAGSIQALHLAFQASGQSAEASEAVVSRFPRLLADLEAGAKRATDSAERLGISIRDQAGNMKTSDEILANVVSSLQAIEDPTERAKEGFLLLGRSAGQFLQALGATSEFENFNDLANTFGTKTGPEASKQAGEFQHRLAFLSIAFKGLQQRIVDALGGIKTFNGLLERVVLGVVKVGDVIMENKDSITEFSKGLGTIALNLIKFFGNITDKFLSAMQTVLGVANEATLVYARSMNFLGQISDDTLQKIETGLQKNENALAGFKKILDEILSTDLSNLDLNLSPNQRKALEGIRSLASGITPTGGGGDGEGLGIPSDVAKQAEENAVNRAFEIIEAFDNAFRIDPSIPDALRKANEDIEKIGFAILDLKEAGEDTTDAEEILAEARRRAEDITRQIAEEEARLAKERLRTANLLNLEFLRSASKTKELTDSVLNSITSKTDEVLSRFGAQFSDGLAIGLVSAVNPALGAMSREFQKVAGKALDVGNTVLTGSVSDIATLIDPILGQTLGILAEVGRQTPEERREQLLEEVEAIKLGLSFLPEILLSVMPQVALALTEAIIDGTVQLFQNLIELLKNGFQSFFSLGFKDKSPDDPETFGEKALRAIKDFFDPDETATFASGGRFIQAGGLSFTGATAPLARLHPNETVVPSSGQRNQATDRQMQNLGGGQNIQVVLNSPAVDQNAIEYFMRQMENQAHPTFGGASSTIFGGR